MKINVFLDGLNQIGYSFALALPKDIFELQAFDPDGKFLRTLKRQKTIKKPIGQIAHGCKNADIIIIDQPVDFLELHYEAIGLNIEPDTIVVDTSPTPLYAGKLAEKFLPDEIAFVSIIPSFNLAALKEQSFIKESGSEELFTKSTMAISTPSTKFKDAEKVATKLAYAVEASVVYMDPFEAQGAMVKTKILPKFVALALEKTISSQPGWRDDQRIASSEYFQATNALLGVVEMEQPELAALENKDSLVRILDEMIAEMSDLRDMVTDGKKKALNTALNEAVESRIAWQEDRRRNSFGGTGSPVDMPENDVFQRMLLGGFGKKKKK